MTDTRDIFNPTATALLNSIDKAIIETGVTTVEAQCVLRHILNSIEVQVVLSYRRHLNILESKQND